MDDSVKSPMEAAKSLLKEVIDLTFLGERGVSVKDRKFRLQTYKNCFLGNVSIISFFPVP